MAELDIEKLKSCTAIKQIPILTLDERWYHLITDKLKTDEICYWEKQPAALSVHLLPLFLY